MMLCSQVTSHLRARIARPAVGWVIQQVALQGQSLAHRDSQSLGSSVICSDTALQPVYTSTPATKPSNLSSLWTKMFPEVSLDNKADSWQPQTQTPPVSIAAVEGGIRAFHQDRDAEVKLEAQVIFEASWRKIEEKYKHDVHVPREVVWLNGAPGSGKGVNTPYILDLRGLSRAISVSSLLENNAEARSYINRGDMIPDTLVVEALMTAIFERKEDGVGILVDGFPRTALQVDLLKLLHDKLQSLHTLYLNTQSARHFPRPSFKVMVLYVDEETSTSRQMIRAMQASKHNLRVKDAGAGKIREERATDVCAEKVRKRYEIFRANYSAILRLKQFFPFHLIDAMGTVDETRAQISRELRYQSSLDLAEYTYEAIRHLPLARDLARTARQQLVNRLDDYARSHREMFTSVIDIIDQEVLPLLRKSGLSGHAEYVSRSRLFTRQPVAIDMLIDVLSDRGFSVSHAAAEEIVPVRFDLSTGEIEVRRDQYHKFSMHFQQHGVREPTKSQEAGASTCLQDDNPEVKITQSFIPAHVDHSAKQPSPRPTTTAADFLPAREFDRQMGYEDGDDIQVYYDPTLRRNVAMY